MAGKVLVVEHQTAIREMLSFVLSHKGYQVVEADRLSSARNKISKPFPDLILLDCNLPDGDGTELVEHVRSNLSTRHIPFIAVNPQQTILDRTQSLKIGAADSINVPFSPKELLARVKTVFKKLSPTSLEDSIEIQGLKLDPLSHRVTVYDQNVELGPTEFKLLHFLITHTDRVFTREQLLNEVWGASSQIDLRTVDVHIRRLRKGISLHGHDNMVQTVRGVGYRFSAGI